MRRFLLIFFIILFQSEINATHRRIGIIVEYPQWSGEIEFAHKIKIAAEQLNWEALIFNPAKLSNDMLVGYDFVLTLTPNAPYFPACPNYLCIMDHYYYYSGKTPKLKDIYHQYDGYLCTLHQKCYVDQLNPVIPWYPSSQIAPYQDNPPTNLFHLISSWGERNKSRKFKEFYELLDQEESTVFYGGESTQLHAPNHHCGSIPFDGCSVIEIQQMAGVVLILHSAKHLINGIPSGRIFEAAAASAVIISDLNPFIIEHFGDSILYVDQNGTAKEMANQVKEHLLWIYSHPSEAKSLAKRVHNIFMSNYTLESQLQAIERFHDELESNKQN